MRKKNYLMLLLILIMMVSLVSSISLIVSAEEMNTEEINFNTASENLTYQGKNNFYMLTGDFSENQLYRMYYNTSYSVWQGYQNYTNWINTSNYNALMPYAGSDAALAYVVPNSGTMVLNGRIIESITGSGLIKASIIQRKNDGSADNIVYESLVTDNINEITLPNCEINVSVGDVIFFIAEENVTVSAWDAIIFDVSATVNKFIDCSADGNALQMTQMPMTGAHAITVTSGVVDYHSIITDSMKVKNVSGNTYAVWLATEADGGSFNNFATEDGLIYKLAGMTFDQCSTGIQVNRVFYSNAGWTGHSGMKYVVSADGYVSILGKAVINTAEGAKIYKIINGSKTLLGTISAGERNFAEEASANNIKVNAGDEIAIVFVGNQAWQTASAAIAFDFYSAPQLNSFESKELTSDSITASVNGSDLIVNLNDSENREYQYWMKSKVDAHILNGNNTQLNVWTLLNLGYSTEKSITVENYSDYNINGYFYIIIKVKNWDGNVSMVMKVLPFNSAGSVITGLTIDSNESKSLNYLTAGNTVSINILNNGISGYTISDNIENRQILTDTFDYTVKEGLYTLKIICNDSGYEYDMQIKGYNLLENYTKITDVKINDTYSFGENIPCLSNAADFNVSTASIGSGSNCELLIESDGKTAQNGIITYTYYGIYSFKISLINENGIIEDYYAGYYNYSRSVNAIEMSLSYQKEGNDYTVSVSDLKNMGTDILYKYIKWDIKGEYAITEWISDNQLTITLSKSGLYKFEVRSKNSDSGSFEIRRYIDISTDESAGISNNQVNITDINGNGITQYQAQEPYKITLDTNENTLQYKFIVSCKGQWNVEEYYSPDNSFVWIPKKTGDYVIQIRILSNDRYGYTDEIIFYNISI